MSKAAYEMSIIKKDYAEMKSFQPDYRNILAAAENRRPERLPFYEHFINNESMEGIDGFKFPDLKSEGEKGRAEFFRLYADFFLRHGYDCASFERCVGGILPDGGALGGHTAGAIHSMGEFEKYPWSDLPRLYWNNAEKDFQALAKALPPGMKAVGGIGNGPFEIAESLVGYESLCVMQYDDPELFAKLFVKIGDLHVALWTEFLKRHKDSFAVCRIGDDMGFKTAPLLAPATLREHVVPQYKRIIKLIREAGKPFLLHSCGCIFDVMDDLIDAGICAKHSNEDAIAPYDRWIELYSSRIGLFGGIDTDRLCRQSPDEIYESVLEDASRFRRTAQGYALGSGNSIPAYVPKEGYSAMLRAGEEIRRRERAH